MKNNINHDILSASYESLAAELGSLDDLPIELADTVANIYYRVSAYQEYLANSDGHILSPYLGKPENWIQSFRDFNEFSAEAISSRKMITDVICIYREARNNRSKSIDKMLSYVLDTYKFRIADVHGKSMIARWIQRKVSTPWVIEGLYGLMKRSISNNKYKKSALGGAQKETYISELHWSAAKGDLIKTREILAAGTSPNFRMLLDDRSIQLCEGATPLHLACANGAVAIVKELLDAGANPNMTTKIGDTPLHWALDVSDKLVLELLESGANHLKTMKGGEIALHWACCPNPVLRWGDGFGMPAIGFLNNEPQTTITLLVNKGSPINQQDNYGWSPLHWRTQLIGGPKGLVKLIMGFGADLSIVNKKGQTPLIQAILSVNPMIVGELIDNGALLPKDYDRLNIIQELSKLRESPSRSELVQLLVEKGVFSEGDDGVTSLLENDRPSVGKPFIEYERPAGLDPEPNIEIIRLLLSNGANINAQNNDGVTPLMVASGAGNSALNTRRAFTDIFYREE